MARSVGPAAIACGVAVHWGPLQNRTTGRRGSSSVRRSTISWWRIRDGAGQRPVRHVLALAAIDEEVAGLDVVDDFELPHGVHRAGQVERLDQPPGGIVLSLTTPRL